jgi:hypothetical protein
MCRDFRGFGREVSGKRRSDVKISSAVAALGILFIHTGHIAAADLSAPPPQEESGIWAAIAYSDIDAKHGFFWGADKRQEAVDIALKHCQDAGGRTCTIVEVFRNHRHWNDDDDTGFPYKHCGALAIGEERTSKSLPWAARSAATRHDAEEEALKACEAAGGKCDIREWVCT